MLKVGSLFSGIGGVELGLERAGFETVWMVENDPHAQSILAEHWPDIPIYSDVRDVGKKQQVSPVNVLAGGFPCQDISLAGKRRGIDGERSGLWREYARLIRQLRPGYVIVENVAALLHRDRKNGRPAAISRVLGDLSESGYDAEWQIIPASAFGAPHLRERLFLVAYPHVEGLEEWEVFGEDAQSECKAFKRDSLVEGSGGNWPPEPSVGRMVDGFPGRVDEIKRLGNAVVPQVAEFVGQRILQRESRLHLLDVA